MGLGEINHISLTVVDLAQSTAFYERVLGFLGYRLAELGDQYAEWKGPCGWFILRPASAELRSRAHDCMAPGLHHLAFSAGSRDEVDRFHREVLLPLGTQVLDPPQVWPQYSAGYYAVFFLDPDGMKLELAHTPAQTWR
jgi:catechol 2,3-dioxygenase-like lactoylglutathione lyase family enzyme